MTTFLLIRHAAHDWLGRELVGRRDGVPINADGVEQTARLARELPGRGIAALYSSPMQRALETAQPIAEALALPVQIAPAFHEIDFGKWTGRTFAELEEDDDWRHWNEHRAIARARGGESMVEVQQRARAGLRALSRQWPRSTIAIVSHGDVIKALLACARGQSLDDLPAIEVEPASINVLHLEQENALPISAEFTATRSLTGCPP